MDDIIAINIHDAKALLNVLNGNHAFDDVFALKQNTMTVLFTDEIKQRLERAIKERGE